MACLEARLAVLGYQSRGSSGDCRTAPVTVSCSATPGESSRLKRRRPSGSGDREDGGDGDEGDGDEDGSGVSKKLKPETDNSRRLACPFLKHDREKYERWKSCVWSGYQTIHRVK